jgi:hypothetical protein
VLPDQRYCRLQGAVIYEYGAMVEWQLIREACSSVTLSALRLKWGHMWSKPGLCREKPDMWSGPFESTVRAFSGLEGFENGTSQIRRRINNHYNGTGWRKLRMERKLMRKPAFCSRGLKNLLSLQLLWYSFMRTVVWTSLTGESPWDLVLTESSVALPTNRDDLIRTRGCRCLHQNATR